MIPEYFNYLTIITGLFASGFYIRDTLKGETKPNRISWSLWAISALIGAFFQVKAGAGLSALPVFMAGFGPFLVVCASFVNKNAYWRVSKLDVYCGILALISLCVYIGFHNVGLAILFAILTDALAGIPTLVKSWKFPETETSSTFLIGAGNAIIGLLTIKEWVFPIYSFGAYLLIANTLLVLAIYRKKIFLSDVTGTSI